MSRAKTSLCYVDGAFAYFTTQPLLDQWGDDWNDAPYEHNAGTPYAYSHLDAKEGKAPWKIIKVAWDGPFSVPCEHHTNSPYSVESINRGACPWLFDRYGTSKIAIPAGVTLTKFKHLVRAAGGKVYTES